MDYTVAQGMERNLPITEREESSMSSFKDLRIVDNFYQTSSYYPMPTVMVSTLAADGSTSVGSYSLCFP